MPACKRFGSWMRTHLLYIGDYEENPLFIAAFLNVSEDADIYEDLLDHSDVRVSVIDTQTFAILYANKESLNDSSFDKNSHEEEKCYHYLHQRSSQCDWCFLKCLKKGKTLYEEHYFPDTGRTAIIQGDYVNWYGREAFVQYSQDITARKNLEKELQDSQTMYRLAIDGAHLGVWVYDIKKKEIINYTTRSKTITVPMVIKNIPEGLFTIFPQEERENIIK